MCDYAWRDIESAPKDGSCILLLSKRYEADGIVFEPKCGIGYWNPKGDSWTDAQGSYDGEICQLTVTGSWFAVEGGWWQPNEVTHWMPLPPPPASTLEE